MVTSINYKVDIAIVYEDYLYLSCIVPVYYSAANMYVFESHAWSLSNLTISPDGYFDLNASGDCNCFICSDSGVLVKM